MQTTERANNLLYFKAYNDDFKTTGIFQSLDNSEFRLYLTLCAYSNNVGEVVKPNTKGYSHNELSKLVNLNYRTTQKALASLSEDWHLISIDEDNRIYITNFLFDANERDKSDGKDRAAARNRAIQQSVANKRARQALEDGVVASLNKINLAQSKLDEKIEKIKVGDANG